MKQFPMSQIPNVQPDYTVHREGAYNLWSCFQFCIKSGIGPVKLLSLILLHLSHIVLNWMTQQGYMW